MTTVMELIICLYILIQLNELMNSISGFHFKNLTIGLVFILTAMYVVGIIMGMGYRIMNVI